MVYDRSSAARQATPRFRCRRQPSCMKSARGAEVMDAVMYALEYSELPKLQEKLRNKDGDAANIQKRRIAKLVKQMEEYKQQEENQFELLETKVYTQDLFDRRNAALRVKMEACEKELALARSALPKDVDYAERIITLEEAIAAMKDPDIPNKEKNYMLRAIVDRIEITLADKDSKEETMRLEVFLRL